MDPGFMPDLAHMDSSPLSGIAKDVYHNTSFMGSVVSIPIIYYLQIAIVSYSRYD
jgi:hypothetical protein